MFPVVAVVTSMSDLAFGLFKAALPCCDCIILYSREYINRQNKHIYGNIFVDYFYLRE